MEYLDINNNQIKQGFYLETFYKEKDEQGNRIIWITLFKGLEGMYTVTNQTTPIPLNPNYSRWLKPIEEQISSLEHKLRSQIKEKVQVVEPYSLSCNDIFDVQPDIP
jgi:hypothetical protein